MRNSTLLFCSLGVGCIAYLLYKQYQTTDLFMSNELFDEYIIYNDSTSFVPENINLIDSSEYVAAINTASQRAFGSRLKSVKNIIKGKCSGNMKILQPNGLESSLKFDHDTCFEGNASFYHDDNHTTTFNTLVYYLAQCFNPVRSAANVDSRNIVFEAYDKTRSILSNNKEYQNLYEDSKHTLTDRSHKLLSAFSEKDDAQFMDNIKTGNNTEYFYQSLKINLGNSAEVNRAINIASHRSYGSLFIPPVVNVTQGCAKGTMIVTYPDGRVKDITFNENEVVFEGVATFWANNSKLAIFTTNVCYCASCFNPVRAAARVVSKVKFYPNCNLKNPKKVTHANQYNKVVTKSRNKIINDLSRNYTIFGRNFMAKDHIWFILDNSGSMSMELRERFEQQIINAFPTDKLEDILIYNNGCGFQRNVHSNSMSKVFFDIVQKGCLGDGIYFYSDFQDGVNLEIDNVIMRELQYKPLKVYLHSIEKQPHDILMRMVEISNGQYIQE